MVSYTLVLQFCQKIGKNKNEDDTFMKKTKEKQKSATMRTSVDGIGIVFLVKWKITREIVWTKILQKRILKKI